MSAKRNIRTIRCLYCGEETTEPSRRGPAPSYCSAAHRQAMHRERHRPDADPAVEPSLREQVAVLRRGLEDASAAASWSEARRALVRTLGPIREPSIGGLQ
ncbi:MAG: hypothetical protein ACYCST_07720 [Acidimicrobiales bacterium]